MTPEPTEEVTPPERRLQEHLGVLRSEADPAPLAIDAIVRRARWQRAVRAPLRTAGLIAAAMADALGVVLAGDGRRRP